MSFWDFISAIFGSKPSKPPVVYPPVPPQAVLARITFHVQDSNARPLADAILTSIGGPGPWRGGTDTDGNFVANLTAGHYVITTTKSGYTPRELPADLADPGTVVIALESAGVDPSIIPLETLARIRGAMWTARLAIPFGPRPNQPSNILAMDFYETYSPEDRKRMLEAYKARGYTHAVTGPIYDPTAYHGQFPASDFRGLDAFNRYLDAMQEWWDAGITPVHFIKPDGWNLEQLMELEPLYTSERAQRLLRIIVPAGWEPVRYEWSSNTWAEFLKWGHRVMPNALILVHTVTDVDALVGTDERGDDNGKDNAEGWKRTAPYMHGWLTQLGGYVFMKDSHGNDMTRESPEFAAGLETFKRNMADYYGGRTGLMARFHDGYAGWPKGSLWGPNIPIKVYAAEFAAYVDYWKDWPEAEACALGDIAIRAGVDGVLDGCTIDVP
jgi:hypothetical protein